MTARLDQWSAARLSGPAESALTKSTPVPKRSGRQWPYGHGAFQLLHIFGAVIALYNYGLHYESFRLTAGVMDHWCRRPDSMKNLSVDEWKQLAIPVDERGKHSHCTMRDPPDGGHAARIVPCASWEFDLGQYGNNIVSHWNLVCDRRWLIDVARLVYAAASMAPLPAVGALADSIGRKVVLFLTVPVVLISGTASAVPNDFHFFVTARAIVSASTSALIPPMYALIYELSPIEKYPATIIMVSLTALVLSPITLFTAQLVKAGWATLQLILMVPTCLLLLLYYTIEESPSWLLETGNVREAERIALRAANMNKVSIEDCRYLMTSQVAEIQARSQDAGHSSGICSPRFRACTITICYMWTAISYAFDTFVINDGVPVGEIATAVSFVICFIVCVTSVSFVPCFGFRNSVVSTGLVFAVTLTALATDLREQTVLRDSLVIVMRATGTVCFSYYLVISVVPYPVMTRCLSVSVGLAFSRLGDTLAQMSPALLGGRRTTLQLAIAAAFMSLFVVGAELVPCHIDIEQQCQLEPSKSSGHVTSEDRKRAMQETLVRLPREPVERRGTTTTKDKATSSDCASQTSREKPY
ncbi:solute carrier family 22 member 6-like [Dermacentor andersoni]|uniref:solute carrier family 22 member 6-like n=1 Tax=Dermacentor andersoni TaxID=34620 RepID=UPI0021552B0C|nr:solute carrier family 22 member 6-like [Dermacentor andersoni]